jgi:hypothetical protein
LLTDENPSRSAGQVANPSTTVALMKRSLRMRNRENLGLNDVKTKGAGELD